MIRHTFCHLPAIGPKRERALWERGVTSWEDCRRRPPVGLRPPAMSRFLQMVDASCEALGKGDPRFFAWHLPPSERWRLYGEFSGAIAYLDIETTADGNGISVISLSDGTTVSSYVRGINLDRFASDLERYPLIVTYNGTCFDLPVIESCLNISIRAAHIDLRFVLRSIGVSGGLKRSERQFGVDRGILTGVDGAGAVWLWDRYLHTGEESALETLLAYNTEDVRYLPLLLTGCYNRLLANTPFSRELALSQPALVHNPYRADPVVIGRLCSLIHPPADLSEHSGACASVGFL